MMRRMRLAGAIDEKGLSSLETRTRVVGPSRRSITDPFAGGVAGGGVRSRSFAGVITGVLLKLGRRRARRSAARRERRESGAVTLGGGRARGRRERSGHRLQTSSADEVFDRRELGRGEEPL